MRGIRSVCRASESAENDLVEGDPDPPGRSSSQTGRRSLPPLALFSFALFVLLQAEAAAQEDDESEGLSENVIASSTIQGVIHFLPLGTSGDSIQVTLKTQTGITLREKFVAKGTSFEFPMVEPGSYVITVESDGYETEEVAVEVQPSGATDLIWVNVTLNRNRGEEADLPPDQQTVSVDELSIPPAALKEIEAAKKDSRKNNPAKAIKHFEKALKICPHLYELYSNLAFEFLRLGQPQKAEELLRRSVELDPGNARTQRNLAQLLIGRGAFEEALRSLGISLQIEPANGKAWMLFGEALVGLGRYAEALSYFQRASEAGAHSHLGMAECHLRMGKSEEALAEYRTFVDQYPGDPRTQAVKARISQLEAHVASQAD